MDENKKVNAIIIFLIIVILMLFFQNRNYNNRLEYHWKCNYHLYSIT